MVGITSVSPAPKNAIAVARISGFGACGNLGAVHTGRRPSASGNSRRLQFWNLTGCIYAKHMCSAAETDPARTAIGQIDDL